MAAVQVPCKLVRGELRNCVENDGVSPTIVAVQVFDVVLVHILFLLQLRPLDDISAVYNYWINGPLAFRLGWGAANRVDNVHSFNHPAKNRILIVKRRLWCNADKELAGRAVDII